MNIKQLKQSGKRLSVFELRKERTQQTTFFIAYLFWLLILLLFTPFTNNLDEIKNSLLYFLGPMLIVFYIYGAKEKTLPLLSEGFLYPLIFFFVVMGISTVLSKHPWVGVFVIGHQIALLGFFLIFYASHRTSESIQKSVYIITVFTFITTVFGVLHYAGMFTVIYKILWGDPDIVMPSTYIQNLTYTFLKSQEMFSTILNRDFYASLLVMLIPIGITSILISKGNNKIILSIASVILMFVCTVLALSKDSFAGLILTLAVYIFLYKRYSNLSKIKIHFLKTGIACSIVLLATLIYFQSPTLFPKLKTFDVSIKSREIIWDGALKMFYKYPVWGGGPGTFRILFPIYRSPEHFLHDISNVTVYAHNRYLDLLSETGTLGFVTYMAFILVLFFRSLKQIRNCEDETLKICQIAFFSGILGILFTNFFSPNSRWTVVGTAYWAIMGVSSACYSVWDQKAKPNREKLFSNLNKILLGSLAFAFLTLIYRVFNLPKEVSFLSILFVIACLILCFYFIIALFAYIKKKQIKMLYDSILICTILISLISAVFSIRYFAAAVYNSEGIMRLNADRHESAVNYFKKAIKLNPSFITSYYKMAHSLHSMGDIEGSLKAYKDLQKYQPDYAEIHYNLGVLYSEVSQNKLQDGNIDEGLKLVKDSVSEYEIAAKMSNKAVIQSALAMSYIRAFDILTKLNKEPELAQKYQINAARTIEKLLERPNPPTRSQYYAETVSTKEQCEPILAQLLYSLKEYSKAEKNYLNLWKKYPDNTNYQVRIIECRQLTKEKSEDSIKFMLDSLKYSPLNTNTHIMISKLYFADKKFNQALRHAQIALKLQPDNSNAQAMVTSINASIQQPQ